MSEKSTYGLIVVSAPSGTGKSTLCTRLLAEESESIHLSISTTSRRPRGQEQDGREYFFVSPEDFRAKISSGEFAEWAEVHGNYYGTEKKMLETFWAKGRHVLLDIDVQGAHSLRTAYPEKSLTVFLAPPSIEELEKRLRGRGTETEDAIQKRMLAAHQELQRKNEFDQIIINDELELAYAQLKALVKNFSKQLERGKWQKHR